MQARWMGIVVLLGCTPRSEVKWEERQDHDEGFLCLSTDDPPSIETLGVKPQVFEPGRPIAIHYDAAQCFSSSCTDDIGVEIETDMDGDTLFVSTILHWQGVVFAEGVGCFVDCVLFDAIVPAVTLEAGSYTMSWAGQQVSFDVPGEALVCAETRRFDETLFE